MYAGKVLIVRDRRRGTAALAWTRSITPARWLAAKLLLPALPITAGTALLYRWARSSGTPALADEWYSRDVFHALGPVNLAYALCGLATGTLAGLPLRRALPAAGLALLTTIVLNALGDRYRERLWPILESPILDHVTAGDPMSSWSVDNGGHPPSHFWPLQLVETGIVLTLTAALTTAAFVVLRRRHG